ncbi:hypothetical protein [Aquimarina sp. MAR_2010_214]|nr:hypothetical protein [Aquimarina sp. MAR_2010_214]
MRQPSARKIGSTKKIFLDKLKFSVIIYGNKKRIIKDNTSE